MIPACRLCPRKCRVPPGGNGKRRLPQWREGPHCPGGPPPVGGASHQWPAGQRHGVFHRVHLGLRLLPERGYQPRQAGGQGSHPPGAFRDLLPAGGGGRPQHQPGDPHPLCPPDPAGPAAEKIAGAGGVQHLRVRAGGNPPFAGGPGGYLPARLQIRRPQPGKTAFPGGGLPCRCPGSHRRDGAAGGGPGVRGRTA